jgi:hypothetical protein
VNFIPASIANVSQIYYDKVRNKGGVYVPLWLGMIVAFAVLGVFAMMYKKL